MVDSEMLEKVRMDFLSKFREFLSIPDYMLSHIVESATELKIEAMKKERDDAVEILKQHRRLAECSSERFAGYSDIIYHSSNDFIIALSKNKEEKNND